MITTTVIYLILLGLLLATSANNRYKRHHIAAKTMASVGFVMISVAGLMLGNRDMYDIRYAYFVALLPGLLFCMAGDIFLAIRMLTKKIKWFAWGITMFAAAHIFFIYFLGEFGNYEWWTYLIPIVSVMVAYILFGLPMIDAGKAKWPCLVYSYVVTLFVVRAFGTMIVWEYSVKGVVIALGAILFYLSDVMLIFLYFGKKEYTWLHTANLTAYYLGIGLIASSVFFL